MTIGWIQEVVKWTLVQLWKKKMKQCLIYLRAIVAIFPINNLLRNEEVNTVEIEAIMLFVLYDKTEEK